ncbi:MAG: hypothetical protein V4611_00830 [Patescibacteria group bacterium]
MSDIDFDELDRAVNGALGAPDTAPAADTSTPTESPLSSEKPVLNTVERTTLIKSTTTATPPAARRSSGRFMDMVHPSSDMRSKTNDAPVVPVQAPAQTAQPLEQPAPAQEPAWNEPLESPFLPDAKVEKRPLGGAANAAVIDSFDFQGLLDEPDEPLLEAPEPQERIEASFPDPIDFAETTNTTVEVEPEVTETEPAPVIEEPLVEEATPEKIDQIEAEPELIANEPVGPTSITQQYKEQPSSNQESGAIYDTESYHQPVAVPPKKKPGWLVFVWIGLLVVLGAGAGWAVYTFVLPML